MIKKILLSSFLLLVPAVSFSRELEIDYPGLETTDTTTIGDVVVYLFSFAIAIGLLVVVAMLIYGGFLYLTSLGDPEKTSKAKNKISSAILGLSVLLLFVLVAQIINPNLLNIEPKEPGEIVAPDPSGPLFVESIKEGHLIIEENPLGYFLENDLNGRSGRETVSIELMGIKKIIKEEREFNPTVTGVSGVNKYLLTMSDRCSCDKLEARCGPARFGGYTIGCDGDPCKDEDGEPRETMDELTAINEKIIKDLMSHRDTILKERKNLETSVRRFQELEQRMSDCQPQGITTTRNQMNMYEEFREVGWSVETKTHKEMNITESMVNPMNFYCAVGGTLMEEEIFPRDDLYLLSNIHDAERARISCPYEYSIGTTSDKVRELTIVQISKMKTLAEKLGDLTMEVQQINEWISEAGVMSCEINCSCIPNLYVWINGVLCSSVVGTCSGEANPHGGPPGGYGNKTGYIADATENIKELEEEIEGLIAEIEGLTVDISLVLGERVLIEEVRDIKEEVGGSNVEGYDEIKIGESYLMLEETSGWIKIRDDIGYKGENEDVERMSGWIEKEYVKIENTDLDRLKEGVWGCHYTEETEKGERLLLLDAERAKGNYRHDQLVIENPHPRNMFCCGLPDELSVSEEDLSIYKDSYYNIITAEGYHTLPWNEENNCVDGWYCESDIHLDYRVLIKGGGFVKTEVDGDNLEHNEEEVETREGELYFVVEEHEDGDGNEWIKIKDDLGYKGENEDGENMVGWINKEDVGAEKYNQYHDASDRLKEQLSCMRDNLDEAEEIVRNQSEGDARIQFGVISYISDHRLYKENTPCSWVHGQMEPGGCSFENETVYGQTRVSPHYGGRDCNDLNKSFAVTFSDIENVEHIIAAAKKCNPFSYVSYKVPNTYKNENIQPHIQISIAGAYGCGTN